MNQKYLRDLSYKSILEMATPEGINASSKEEIYGCIFGRDSAITILKILKPLYNKFIPYDRNILLDISKRSLLTLCNLQGKEINVESGEEPGKFIHEFRREKHEHLTKGENPWFVYEDGTLKNYDSIDSTPLVLIAIYKYWRLTKDNEFLSKVLPNVENGLKWIMNYSDKDNDYLLEYDYPIQRKSGGLKVQSWTDSHESLRRTDGTMPEYPVAPVEVQGYSWQALKFWADFYLESNKEFSEKLLSFADNMKKEFNRKFIFKDAGFFFAAQALDGNKNQIQTITGNPLLLLWAAYKNNGKTESIVNKKYIKDIVKRSFQPDLFDKDAGIRTMSTNSNTFNPNQDSYHNGSFWPKLNGMAHEGLCNFGFSEEVQKLKEATLKPLFHFGTPIELYTKNSRGEYFDYCSSNGQRSCRYQAWSAAVAMDLLAA